MFKYGDVVWCGVDGEFWLDSFSPKKDKFIVISNNDSEPNKILLIPARYEGWPIKERDLHNYNIPHQWLGQKGWLIHQNQLSSSHWEPCWHCSKNFVHLPYNSNTKCWECSL